MKPAHLLSLAAGVLALSLSSAAPAAIPASLYDPANCTAHNGAPLNYTFCDDGVPAAGGRTANSGGVQAITVPAEYGGDGYTGLPAKKTPTSVGGADSDGNIALDVDISLPLTPPPSAGYPILFMMHGCCGGNKTGWESTSFDAAGESWHYNNAWFASRGYVVVTYTARGFASNGPNGPNRAGSTGETQLDSRKFEINDYQHLACQILANAAHWNAATGQTVKINPRGVVVTGGSYGGGFSWMALTDPVWTCTPDTGDTASTEMRLAAAAPRYGWTDLLYSLVPTGRHSSDPAHPPATDGCDSGPRKPDGSDCANPVPAGIAKMSILAGLYGTGVAGATFPQKVTDAFACLQSSYPPEGNPLCDGTAAQTNVLGQTLPEFLADRSAYYQDSFFQKIASDPSWRIPVFNAATLTDPLFPSHEDRRMHNRLLAATGGAYPLQSYFGDYQHFVQNKPKEWGDLCGADHHVCNNADFGGNFNALPASLIRLGITSRLNRFLDYYAKPAANPTQTGPTFGVTAALTVCTNKTFAASVKTDEPGDTYVSDRFERLTTGYTPFDSGLTPATLTLASSAATTSSSAPGNGTHADPVADSQMTDKCPIRKSTDPAPAGVAVYETAPLADDLILIGSTGIGATFAASGDNASVQLNARLYEVLSSGDAVLADRGVRRLSSAEVAQGSIVFETFGNGWRFTKGNKIRLELAQDDSPFAKASTPASSLNISRAVISLPTRPLTGIPNTGGGTPIVAADSGGALNLPLLAGLGALLALRRRKPRR